MPGSAQILKQRESQLSADRLIQGQICIFLQVTLVHNIYGITASTGFVLLQQNKLHFDLKSVLTKYIRCDN